MTDRGVEASSGSVVTHDVTLMGAALEHLPDITTICEAVCDQHGRVTDLRLIYMNASARAAQPGADDAIGRLGTELWPESVDNGALGACIRVLETGTTESGSQRWDEGGGFRVGGYDWLATRLAPGLLMWVKHDDTERLQLIDELRRKEQVATEASRAKSEFVSVMAHELRTPLNSILGFAQLLQLDDLSRDQAESVDFIGRAGQHLLHLVDDLLDIGRIERGSDPSDERSPTAGSGGVSGNDAVVPARRARVLCIEDNIANLTLVERALTHSPVPLEVIGVPTAGAGLEVIRADPPDLVLLDLRLPDRSGEEVLRLLRNDPATRDLRIVILSADAHHDRMDELRTLGADDYLTKPLDLALLLATVARFVPSDR